MCQALPFITTQGGRKLMHGAVNLSRATQPELRFEPSFAVWVLYHCARLSLTKVASFPPSPSLPSSSLSLFGYLVCYPS